MKKIYFYRGETIWHYENGWLTRDNDPNIYKTVNDAKNAIDKFLGGTPTARIAKRTGEPIKIIGQFK